MSVEYMEKGVKTKATRYTEPFRVVKTKTLLKIFRRTSEV